MQTGKQVVLNQSGRVFRIFCENLELFLAKIRFSEQFRTVLSLLSCSGRSVLSVLSRVTCQADLFRPVVLSLLFFFVPYVLS
jgi:hypothetical protein